MKAIVALSPSGIIGSDGKIPWDCPEDMKFFVKVRKQATKIIMGGRTYRSLPQRMFKPGVEYYVYTRTPVEDAPEGIDIHTVDDIDVFTSVYFEDALLIGGKGMYEALADHIDLLYLTVINKEFKGDTKLDFRKVLGEMRVHTSMYQYSPSCQCDLFFFKFTREGRSLDERLKSFLATD